MTIAGLRRGRRDDELSAAGADVRARPRQQRRAARSASTMPAGYAPAAWATALVGPIDGARHRTSSSHPAPTAATRCSRTSPRMLDLPMAANCVAVDARRPGHGDPRALGRQPARGGAAARRAGAADGRAPRRRRGPGRRRRGRAGRGRPDARAYAVPERVETVTAGVSLADADVVVSGGRGVGSAEGFSVIEELAELLGGAVGCSRAVTSAGWRPHTDQVGQTGTKISPEIYIACGISGATQHMAGCKGAKKLLAINPDGEASIFASADYAVIGDLHEVVPAISAEIRKAEGHSLADRRGRAGRRRSRSAGRCSPPRAACCRGSSEGRADAAPRRRAAPRCATRPTIVLGPAQAAPAIRPGADARVHLLGLPRSSLPTILIALIGIVDKHDDAPVARPSGLVRAARRHLLRARAGRRARRAVDPQGAEAAARSRAATSARPT